MNQEKQNQKTVALADCGLYGLAVMGSNLARNIESVGYRVAVCNRTSSVTDEFMTEFSGSNFVPAQDVAEFVQRIARPRKIILMVKAGAPTDAVIVSMLDFMEAGDILIDGGNAWFKDTQRRVKFCAEKEIEFIGAGISGGEEGALKGPSIMPGGKKSSWELISDMLAKISAKVDGQPCSDYIGPDGSGHFVKMVHNGIEYADMQLIAESYDLLAKLNNAGPPELAEIYGRWNKGVLDSYLIEITAEIFRKRDPNLSEHFLIDQILDKAGQKGTGQWTAEIALALGVAVPTINAAVNARTISSFKSLRKEFSQVLEPATNQFVDLPDNDQIESACHDALYAAKIIAYAQGMDLIKSASEEYEWKINLVSVANLWRGGCIIRAKFLNDIAAAYREEPDLANLMIASFMRQALADNVESLRYVVSLAAQQGIPVLALSSALAYYDSYRLANLPQNLTQAQRDFFGAHTYQRKDQSGFFHTDWE